MKLWLLAIAACGRVDFTPIAQATPGDDVDAPAAAHDAPSSACAAAIDAALGTSAIQNSCDAPAGGLACGPTGTPARLYRFTATTAGSYTFEALDATDDNITNHSVVRLDPTCTQKRTCAGIYATGLAAGETVYFSVGSDVGGCAMYRVSITSP